MQLKTLFEFLKYIQLVEVQIPQAAFTLSLREWEKTMPSPLTESMRAGHMPPMLLPPSGCSGYCKCPSTNQHSREVGIWQRRFDLTQPCLWRQAPLWPDNYLKHLHRWWQSIRWGLITQYTAAEWHTTPDTLCDVTIIKQSRPRSLKNTRSQCSDPPVVRLPTFLCSPLPGDCWWSEKNSVERRNCS